MDKENVFTHGRVLLCHKKCKLQSCVGKWTHLETVMLGGINQTHEFQYRMASLIGETRAAQTQQNSSEEDARRSRRLVTAVLRPTFFATGSHGARLEVQVVLGAPATRPAQLRGNPAVLRLCPAHPEHPNSRGFALALRLGPGRGPRRKPQGRGVWRRRAAHPAGERKQGREEPGQERSPGGHSGDHRQPGPPPAAGRSERTPDDSADGHCDPSHSSSGAAGTLSGFAVGRGLCQAYRAGSAGPLPGATCCFLTREVSLGRTEFRPRVGRGAPQGRLEGVGHTR
ncbi:PREDICTED: uncharacterized protein LOC106148548 isoform X1 [Chinchilla lanigera]|uniref:uncharacterized protein LOC106148548 isoform X1 n=1 Tax=Chinchilla lanigera TaxID=34839 RepID=UPI000698B46E|nr:PREDICTED: uncharacterized protein LOC106148548 isoform X1 [Chinchilla lanigera]